ncbi:MAG: YheV family putative zinc ribbon protein [Oleibacter sp.]|nr:YheV family putative zinc ribbon protein [Thalassolituus sp.]
MTEFVKKRPRRFIAGAVCPKCSKMDTTVMFINDEEEEVRECIECEFSQTSSEQAAEDSAQEMVTRVTPVNGKAVLDDGEQPLKIMQMPSDKN